MSGFVIFGCGTANFSGDVHFGGKIFFAQNGHGWSNKLHSRVRLVKGCSAIPGFVGLRGLARVREVDTLGLVRALPVGPVRLTTGK